MTEIYHGPWSPVYGDRPMAKGVEDAYHPKYPDTKGADYPRGYQVVKTERAMEARAEK